MTINNILGIVVGIVIISGGAFYGGTVYEKSNQSARGNFQGQFPGGGMGMRSVGGMGGFTAGEIIGKNDTSITVKMQDGSTKIVLVGTGAQVMKSTTGSTTDLAVGTQVMVTGSGNSDGSITAQSVQIRPLGSMPFGGRMQQGSRSN